MSVQLIRSKRIWKSIDNNDLRLYERVLLVKDCGDGTIKSVSVGYLSHDSWCLDYTSGSADKYGYRITHWDYLPELPKD